MKFIVAAALSVGVALSCPSAAAELPSTSADTVSAVPTAGANAVSPIPGAAANAGPRKEMIVDVR